MFWKSVFFVSSILLYFLIHVATVHAALWECGERSNLPQEGKNYCAAGDFRQVDSALEKLFIALSHKHTSAYGNADALRNAQDAFIRYRDQQCTAETQRVEEEPFHDMMVAQCQTRMTNQRIVELKRMMGK